MENTVTPPEQKTKQAGETRPNLFYIVILLVLVFGGGVFGKDVYNKVAGESFENTGIEIYLNSAEKVAQGLGGKVVEVVIRNNSKEDETYNWVLKRGDEVIESGEVSLQGGKSEIVEIDQVKLVEKYQNNVGEKTFVEFEIEGYSSYLRWPVGGL
jgi:hypothetical protein